MHVFCLSKIMWLKLSRLFDLKVFATMSMKEIPCQLKNVDSVSLYVYYLLLLYLEHVPAVHVQVHQPLM